MRVALISDVHGNAVALDAVLADIEGRGADALVFLGDAATVGPQPVEALARLKETGCACIRGNHDEAVLEMERAEALLFPLRLISTLQWCAQRLSPDDREYLRSFTPTLRLSLGPGATLLCCHGSPRSNIEGLLATTPPETLDTFFEDPTIDILAAGHTHIQMLRQHAGRLIVNPGSVGHAFVRTPAPGQTPELLPWAEYALLTWHDGTLSVDLRRVPYDHAALVALLVASDLPIKDWWLEQLR